MNIEGLNIGLEDFEGLTMRKQNSIIYKNLIELRKEKLNTKVRDKINYFWLAGLTIALGLKKVIGF
jgi:hypothetical protein